MDVVFAQLAKENPQAAFLRVEAEELFEASEKYGCAAVPFFAFVKSGQQVDSLEGASAPAGSGICGRASLRAAGSGRCSWIGSRGRPRSPRPTTMNRCC